MYVSIIIFIIINNENVNLVSLFTQAMLIIKLPIEKK